MKYIKRLIIANIFAFPIVVFMEAIADIAWNNNEDVFMKIAESIAGISILLWGYFIATKIDK